MASLTRPQRIALVRGALSREDYKTTAVIAEETGLSAPLVVSTIRLIQEVTTDEALTYNQRHGWKVAESWDEKRGYVRWLHRHLTTRVETLSRHVDVARGLWGDDVPPMLAATLSFAVKALDFATSAIAVPESEPTPIHGPSRTTVLR